MIELYFKKFLLILCLASLFSCSSKYGVLKYDPKQEYTFTSEKQTFCFPLEDFSTQLAIHYWEGSRELVKHTSTGHSEMIDFFLEGEWFTAQATHEIPTRLEIKLDKNESNNQRHMEIYVDIVNRNCRGKTTQKTGHGYHLFLHQAAGF